MKIDQDTLSGAEARFFRMCMLVNLKKLLHMR